MFFGVGFGIGVTEVVRTGGGVPGRSKASGYSGSGGERKRSNYG